MPETNGIGFNGIERKQPKMIVFDLGKFDYGNLRAVEFWQSLGQIPSLC